MLELSYPKLCGCINLYISQNLCMFKHAMFILVCISRHLLSECQLNLFIQAFDQIFNPIALHFVLFTPRMVLESFAIHTLRYTMLVIRCT